MRPIDFLDANPDYVDDQYRRWVADPEAVDEKWAIFFAGFEAGWKKPPEPGEAPAEAAPSGVVKVTGGNGDREPSRGTYGLVNAYREFGHIIARLDPLGRANQDAHPFLDPSRYGCSPSDGSRDLGAGGFLGPKPKNLDDLIDKLRTTYCGTLAVDFMDLDSDEQRSWLIERIETDLNQPGYDATEKRRILESVMEAETFEQFLGTKYLGKKRFSVEGGETLLPVLETLVDEAADGGVEEMIFGMAHRGRLNVLAHVLNKPYEEMLGEFEGREFVASTGDGDVKYHMGYSYDHVTKAGRRVHLSLSPNPSHLELVDPVIEGVVRAKQEYLHDTDRSRVVPVMIHGDAAFTGQGVVFETLALSELDDYTTGGTIHVVVNNQVGFTAMPHETRFTRHPTDIGKMFQAPAFHVNADDPEAGVRAVRLALAYRQRFKTDVIINLVCYRRHGHNETDDPTYTQPLMYQVVKQHPTVVKIYSDRLLAEGSISETHLTRMRTQLKDRLEEALENMRRETAVTRMDSLGGVWSGFTRAGRDWSAKTGVRLDEITWLAERLHKAPEGFHVHRKVQRLLDDRMKMARGEKPIDWGCAEHWAYGTLCAEGTPVRLAGQDAGRGTFSHRHAVLRDTETGEAFVPLANLRPDQGEFTVINTMLSELAVLGFEYGMSWADPRRLVIWEAQFGDFANGAQAMFDQFISSAESKWERMSGLTMLLPHGYEGQGPEHSSARLERFLQLCAEDNWQVVNLTTPAQIFHALRRQMHRRFRKPLVVMSPKRLLRHPDAVSSLEDFGPDSKFEVVLDDPEVQDPASVKRVAFMSGKIYYTFREARAARGAEGMALVRLEQLYPFPEAAVIEVMNRYPNAREFFWVQEEPRNMGAWFFAEPLLREMLGGGREVFYCGRDGAASPAVGNFKAHDAEETELLDQFFGPTQSEQGEGGQQGISV